MKQTTSLIAAVMISLSFASYAAEDHPGKALHDESCSSCHIADHDAAFYTRADRKITSYDGLQSMVRMCDANLGTKLFDEDMTEIGNYLNQAYYKFPEK